NQWATTPGGSMPHLPLLDWQALGRLAAEGVMLGAHSRTHADLRRLGDAEIADEIEGSLDDIASEIGQRPDGFAYPYGYLDERVVRQPRPSCRWACTTMLRPLSTRDDPYRLPRLDAYFLRGPARLEAYGSLAFRSYMSMRATVRRLRGR